jgi:phosphoenolpyruvate carboxykinase (ATP)
MAGPGGEFTQGGNGGTPEIPGGDPGDQGQVPASLAVELVHDFRANLAPEQFIINPSHELLFEAVDPKDPEKAERWGVTITATGAWSEVNPGPERARSPMQTFFVKDGENGGPQGEKIYWPEAGSFRPIGRKVFSDLLEDSLAKLSERTVYLTERQVGKTEDFAFPVDTFSDSPSSAAFSNNMFKPRDAEAVGDTLPLTVIVLPHDDDKIKPADFGLEPADFGLEDPDPEDPDALPVRTGLIITDPETNTVLIRGFAYHGPIKKTVFTLVNHIAPDKDGFPVHASASVGPEGDVAVYCGLSGTGKSTIGALFEEREVIGDDELIITPKGRTVNVEEGVYPKVIGISSETEPALVEAAFTDRPPEANRAFFQNVVLGKGGEVDVNDASLTENTRVSVPMEYLPNAQEAMEGGPPENIFFITMDVGGVLPPIARLSGEQALFWFLMGPTSKTTAEIGAKPGATFSPFFGGPFMPRHPAVYMQQLAKTLDAYEPTVWLVNTGFTGGPKGDGGQRISIPDTKAAVGAALNGDLDRVAFTEDERFKIWVPDEIPGSKSASALLEARDTWQDPAKYDAFANNFAQLFLDHFRANYGDDPDLAAFERFSPAPLNQPGPGNPDGSVNIPG